MIDLHTHLLPGVDDGSPTMEHSRRVLHRFATEGITVVACTPHLAASALHAAPLAEHDRLRAELRAGLPPELSVVAGFEVMLDVRGVDLRTPGIALGGSHAVLVEFPHGPLADGHTEELLRLRAGGTIPVLAHPERYRGATVDLVRGWREAGAVIQGDALTLLSAGPKAQLARLLLDEGLYDILASDNHGDRRSLATVRLWLRELGGDGQGRLLTEDNPARVLADEPLLPVPPLRRAWGWWARLRALAGRR